ncbi:hypothetical protein BD311DRAFT_750453 [Dichomitus squalens]|uniref:Uncharacterized protein n=1 Tax=Dichomitus squalens TaxID=114155 RepID=A0A4Q9MYX8_9APHY|nr:hypothetical protein BD311DRAFT_750453 [Dichomitus squalens]
MSISSSSEYATTFNSANMRELTSSRLRSPCARSKGRNLGHRCVMESRLRVQAIRLAVCMPVARNHMDREYAIQGIDRNVRTTTCHARANRRHLEPSSHG